MWGLEHRVGPKETRILAHQLGAALKVDGAPNPVPTATDLERALPWSDGFQFSAAVLADGPAVMRPVEDRWGLDLRVGDAPLFMLTRADVATLTGGPAPMSLEEGLRLIGDRPVNIDLCDEFVTADLVELMRRSETDSGCVVVTSLLNHVPRLMREYRGDSTHPVSGLRLSLGAPRRSLLADIFPWRLLRSARAECVALDRRLYRSGVLHYCGGRPSIVGPVNDEPTIRRCLADPRVHGIVTDKPELAHLVRQSMSRPA